MVFHVEKQDANWARVNARHGIAKPDGGEQEGASRGRGKDQCGADEVVVVARHAEKHPSNPREKQE